jgi:hypothetical protein
MPLFAEVFAQSVVAPDRLIEGSVVACFRLCSVSDSEWCHCESRRRVNSGPLCVA